MMGLTEQQSKLLSFIRSEAVEGRCPTYVQMADHIGVKSKSNIHRLLNSLEERGYIRRLEYRQQAIEIIDQRETPFLSDLSLSQIAAECRRRGFQVVSHNSLSRFVTTQTRRKIEFDTRRECDG